MASSYCQGDRHRWRGCSARQIRHKVASPGLRRHPESRRALPRARARWSTKCISSPMQATSFDAFFNTPEPVADISSRKQRSNVWEAFVSAMVVVVARYLLLSESVNVQQLRAHCARHWKSSLSNASQRRLDHPRMILAEAIRARRSSSCMRKL